MNPVIEKEILEKAVAALARQTGLQTENYSRSDKRGVRADYKLAFRAPHEKRARFSGGS